MARTMRLPRGEHPRDQPAERPEPVVDVEAEAEFPELSDVETTDAFLEGSGEGSGAVPEGRRVNVILAADEEEEEKEEDVVPLSRRSQELRSRSARVVTSGRPVEGSEQGSQTWGPMWRRMVRPRKEPSGV